MKIKVMDICGIRVICDPKLPIATWYLDQSKTHELAHFVSKLDTFLMAHDMKLVSIEVEK